MNDLNKFFKFAKDIIVKPSKDTNIEDKIIEKIRNLSDEDKTILDNNFKEFLKKYNSRFYLFKKTLKENCALVTILSIVGVGATIFFLMEYNNYKNYKNKN
jgi:hypothetical protein